MGIIGFILFGLVLGALARLILPGRQRIGILMTVLLGVAGSLVGGFIATAIGSGDYFELNFIGFVCALVASVVLLAAGEAIGIGGGRDRRRLGR